MKNYSDLLTELRQVAKIGNHKTALDRVETLLTRLVEDVESMQSKLVAAGVGAAPPEAPAPQVLVEPAPVPATAPTITETPAETPETDAVVAPEAEAAPAAKKTVSKTKRKT